MVCKTTPGNQKQSDTELSSLLNEQFRLTERLFQCLMSNQYGDFTSWITVCWELSSLTIFVHIRLKLKRLFT